MRSQDGLDVFNKSVILACVHRKINIFQGKNCMRVQHNLSCYGSLESQHSDKCVIPYKLYRVDNNCGKYLSKDGIVHLDHRNLLLITSISQESTLFCTLSVWTISGNLQDLLLRYRKIHMPTLFFFRGITSKLSKFFPMWLHSKRYILVKQQFKVSFSI